MMPWVEIPPERIIHLSLFGYRLLKHTETGAWYEHEHTGKIFIENAKPIVWAEDEGEAMEMRAIAIRKGTPPSR